MKVIKLVFILFISLSCFAQTDSCKMEISLITCGPGQELYSIFGHSAIRVSDKSAGKDIIFNYGTFDFEDPDFYAKFVSGKLLYFVSTSTFSDFLYEYQYEGRSVIEQVLKLTCEEKEKLFRDLRINAKEENKYYNYDFIYDNCSTRLRDILNKNEATFNNFRQESDSSFRDLIHQCLDNGNQLWSKFGIDLILGSPLDKKADDFHAMFLPDYLMRGFENATTGNGALVRQTKNILPLNLNPEDSSFLTPNVFSISLFIIILVLSLLERTWARSFLNIFDFAYFFILGLLGFFLLFMWFGTDHQLAAYNYSLLWAMPTHLPIAFLILRDKKWVRKYFKVAAIIYILLILSWNWLPQGMNFAFLPLALTALTRCYFHSIKKIMYAGDHRVRSWVRGRFTYLGDYHPSF